MLPGTWRHWAAGTLVTALQGFGQNLPLLVWPLLGFLQPFAHHLEGLGEQSVKQNWFYRRWGAIGGTRTHISSCVLPAPIGDRLEGMYRF